MKRDYPIGPEQQQQQQQQAQGQSGDDPRINRQIRTPKVRVIGDDGEQLGILDIRDAIQMAEEKGLDLVEVSPAAWPPVCKFMDFGKFKYAQKKKAAETKKRVHQM